jgi:hypothetical protein
MCGSWRRRGERRQSPPRASCAAVAACRVGRGARTSGGRVVATHGRSPDAGLQNCGDPSAMALIFPRTPGWCAMAASNASRRREVCGRKGGAKPSKTPRASYARTAHQVEDRFPVLLRFARADPTQRRQFLQCGGTVGRNRAQVAIVEDHVRRYALGPGLLQPPLTQILEKTFVHDRLRPCGSSCLRPAGAALPRPQRVEPGQILERPGLQR